MIFKGKLNFIYANESCTFRSINPDDVTEAYINGLAHENKYLSNIPKKLSVISQRDYITTICESSNDTICGLFLGDELVGTAGVQNLVSGAYAAVGIFLFSPYTRGKGFGKVMVWGASLLAGEEVQIIGTMGGMKPDNLPSLKSFISCGGKAKHDEKRDIHTVFIDKADLVTLPGLSKIEFTIIKDET
jgi:hypothetical protein